MSLKPFSACVVPEQTASVARAALPAGSLCIRIFDELGTIFQDQDFADLYSQHGQPWKFALYEFWIARDERVAKQKQARLAVAGDLHSRSDGLYAVRNRLDRGRSPDAKVSFKRGAVFGVVISDYRYRRGLSRHWFGYCTGHSRRPVSTLGWCPRE
jgi:hypothetical protein